MNREKIDDLIADYSDAYADSVADLSMYTARARVAETYKELMDYLDELESENAALLARAERAEAMVERLIEAIELGNEVPLMHEPEITGVQSWYKKMHALVAEWKAQQ